MKATYFVGLDADIRHAVTALEAADGDLGEQVVTTADAVSVLGNAEDVVFVVARSNAYSTSLVLLVEAAVRASGRAKHWVWSIDGADVHPVHRDLVGLPAWPSSRVINPPHP